STLGWRLGILARSVLSAWGVAGRQRRGAVRPEGEPATSLCVVARPGATRNRAARTIRQGSLLRYRPVEGDSDTVRGAVGGPFRVDRDDLLVSSIDGEGVVCEGGVT